MKGLSKPRVLEELRARIETIENHPRLAGAALDRPVQGKLLGMPAGVLHEVFTGAQRNAGAAFGFALAAAHGLQTSERPAILIVQLVRDSQALGVPYGAGFASFGIDPDSIVLCRPETIVELLWAIEEAIACKAVAAVVADIGHDAKALDFTASRRLSLRSAAGGSSIFLVRYGKDREASAARFRWRIEPEISRETAFDPRAPGGPRWQADLEKGRLGSRRDPVNWVLDWTENGFVLAEPQKQPLAPAAAGTAIPRASPAPLGHRLSQAG